MVKTACSAGDQGSIPGLGRSPRWRGGTAAHSSVLAWRIPVDRGAWQTTNSPWCCKELDTTERLSTAHKMN